MSLSWLEWSFQKAQLSPHWPPVGKNITIFSLILPKRVIIVRLCQLPPYEDPIKGLQLGSEILFADCKVNSLDRNSTKESEPVDADTEKRSKMRARQKVRLVTSAAECTWNGTRSTLPVPSLGSALFLCLPRRPLTVVPPQGDN